MSPAWRRRPFTLRSRHGVRVLARRDADQPLEVALQMIRAAAQTRRQRRQRRDDLRRSRGRRRRGGSARSRDPPAARRVRLAALAGAETGRARGVGRVEETHAIAARPPARAGRPAVDAGRGHGVHEPAVRRRVAGQHRVPGRGVGRAPTRSADRLRQSIHAQRMEQTVARPPSAACDRIVLRRGCSTKTFVVSCAMSDFRYALRTLLKAPGLHHRRRPDAGARHRRQHRDLLADRPGAAADAAGASRPSSSSSSTVPGAFRGRTFNNGTFSYPMYRDFRDRNTVFDGVLARFPASLTLLANGQAERVNGELVIGQLLRRPRRPRADRPHLHAGRRPDAGWTSGRGAQPRLLDAALRRRSVACSTAPSRSTACR